MCHQRGSTWLLFTRLKTIVPVSHSLSPADPVPTMTTQRYHRRDFLVCHVSVQQPQNLDTALETFLSLPFACPLRTLHSVTGGAFPQQ